LADRILSLAEITALEQACELGAPLFSQVLEALLARWNSPLRDAETATRLLYYIHEGHTTQPQYTGIESVDLPSAERVLEEAGGEEALPADTLFALALLLSWQAWPFGDAASWTVTSRRWAETAMIREPKSRLFREWKFFFHEARNTDGPKVYIEPEIHARYHGRGMFGQRMVNLLTQTLWRGKLSEGESDA
jgi:hypothetical protein